MDPFTIAFLLLSSVIGIVGGVASNQAQTAMNERNIEFQKEANQQMMEFNSAEAEKQRAWEEQMSNTQVQRAMADYQAAGLNPILAVPGGASYGSGATAQANISAPKQSYATSVFSGILSGMTNTMQSMTNFMMTKKLLDSKTALNNKRIEDIANKLDPLSLKGQKIDSDIILNTAKTKSILNALNRSNSSAYKTQYRDRY